MGGAQHFFFDFAGLSPISSKAKKSKSTTDLSTPPAKREKTKNTSTPKQPCVSSEMGNFFETFI